MRKLLIIGAVLLLITAASAFFQINNPGTSGTVTSIATTSPISGGTITGSGTLTCPTCVVASSPGAGIAHFAGATQTVTSSAIVNGDIAASTIDLTAKVTGVLPTANGGDKGGIVQAFCTGAVGTVTLTEYQMAPMSQTTNCTSTAAPNDMPMPYACTLKNLTVKATAGGASGSGIIKIYKNGAQAGSPGNMTCTLGTGTTCQDATNTISFAANDVWRATVTTGQATDTTANIRVAAQCQ